MSLGGRQKAQLALMAMGLIVWGYGQRIEDSRLTQIGLLFFVAAAVLRIVWRIRGMRQRSAGDD
jgi:hypothetical protein